MADGVVFSEQAFRQLKRELAELRLRHRNLDRQVTAQRAGMQGSAGYTDRPPVMVRNQSGGTLDRGSVVEFIDEHVRAVPRAGKLWFDGDTPDLTNPGWGILDRKIPDGRSCKCYVTGPCVALVNVQATTDKYAFFESGSTVLKGDRFWGDAVLLKPPTGTGEQLLPISIQPSPNEWLGKTDSAINKGASGTVSVWSGTPGSETDTTFNITSVYNRFVNIGSGKWVVVQRIHRKPYIIAAECPPT